MSDSLSYSKLCMLANAYGRGVPPNLVVAIIMEESGGQPDAVSEDGAVGLMQLVKRYHKGVDLTSPEINVALGCKTLIGFYKYVNAAKSPQWDDTEGVRRALAAYVMGPVNVEPYSDEGRWSEQVKNYCDNIMNMYQNRRFCDGESDD